MPKPVDEILRELRAHFRVEQDSDLARKLGVDKSTVSTWRNRNSVPQRYVDILFGLSHETIGTPPARWGEIENAAFTLALFRFSAYSRTAVESGDLRDVTKTFRNFRFWLVFKKCQEDIIEDMSKPYVNSGSQAQALIIAQDLRDMAKMESDIQAYIDSIVTEQSD